MSALGNRTKKMLERARELRAARSAVVTTESIEARQVALDARITYLVGEMEAGRPLPPPPLLSPAEARRSAELTALIVDRVERLRQANEAAA